MEKEYKNLPNKEILDSMQSLMQEFNKTKNLIISLTEHLDSVEDRYNKLNKEIKKRMGDGDES
jgi:predicted  nucleic acid-binding Zn-ribbon protein